MTSPNKNAPHEGRASLSKLAGGGSAKRNLFRCGLKHTSKLHKEVKLANLGLRNARGATQLATLLALLKHLGPRGLNTKEGEALGYYRIATRVQELEEDGWHIASLRESILGADGLPHHGIARYVLLGRVEGFRAPQLTLDLGGTE